MRVKPWGLFEGSAADLTVLDLSRNWTFDVKQSRSRSRNSPFHGWQFTGKAVATIVGGKVVYEDREVARLLILILSCAAVYAQVTSPQRILANTKFQAAEDFIGKDHDRFVKETIQITEVEAPPFKEEKRAKLFAEMLRQSGLSDVEIDAEGNVIGVRKGVGNGPLDRHRRASGYGFSGRHQRQSPA